MGKIKKDILNVFLIIVMVVVVSVIYAIVNCQNEVLFHPRDDKESYSKLQNIDDFDEIIIDTDTGKLHGWMKYNNDKNIKSPLVIFFQGNAQCSSNVSYDMFRREIFKYFSGYNVLIIDYPGYGLNEGEPSDKSMFKMSLDTYNYAINLECVDKDNIVVLGYSIGTGVATYLASQVDVNGLILLAPYDNSQNLYNSSINIFYGPLKSIIKYHFDSDTYAPNVKIDPLIIATNTDEVVPYELAVNLKDYFNSVYKFITIEGINHGDFFYTEKVLNFIQEYLQEKL